MRTLFVLAYLALAVWAAWVLIPERPPDYDVPIPTQLPPGGGSGATRPLAI